MIIPCGENGWVDFTFEVILQDELEFGSRKESKEHCRHCDMTAHDAFGKSENDWW